MQRAQFDARDRAAAGADSSMSIIGSARQPGGVAADEGAARHQHVAVMDDAGLGGRAAHVEGDGVLEPDAVAQRLGADHSGAGPDSSILIQELCASSTPNKPPVDCTIKKSPSKAGGIEVLAHFTKVSPHPGTHISVGRRVEVRSNSRYSCDSSCDAVAKSCGWLCAMIAFARCRGRVAVGVQEQDRDRLRALRDGIGDGRAHLVLVELDQHLALGVHALATS